MNIRKKLNSMTGFFIFSIAVVVQRLCNDIFGLPHMLTTKRRLIFLMILFGIHLHQISSAQSPIENLAVNGDFETFPALTCCSGEGGPSMMNCIDGWFPSHGGPILYSEQAYCPPTLNSPQFPAPNCWNKFGLMAARVGFDGTDYFQESRGAFQQINFKKGVAYELYFEARVGFEPVAPGFFDGSRLIVAVANDVPTYTECLRASEEPLPDVNNKQIIFAQNFTFEVWQLKSVTFIPDADYQQLWFYMEPVDPTDVNANQRIDFDDVEVTLDCLNDKYYQNTSSLPSLTKVANSIEAGSNVIVNDPQGPVTVENGQAAIFESNSQIILKPGFHAKNGSDFHALILDCGLTTSDLNDPVGSTGSRVAGSIQNQNFIQELGNLKNVTQTAFLGDAFPNPSKGTVHIEYSSSGSTRLYLTDLSGRLIKNLSDKDSQKEISHVEFDTSELKAGVYLYILEDGDTKITKKMIID